jgi:hypothetical protein
MSPIRKLLLVAVGVLALYGLEACTSETELNPQPLPPQGGTSGEPARDPNGKASDGTPTGGGTGTTPPPIPATPSDAGAADSGDASDDGHD